MIVQCDWLSVSGCVENVLVGGRNFNKFKSVPVTDKCYHGGTEDPVVVTPSHHQEISYATHQCAPLLLVQDQRYFALIGRDG